MADELPFDDLIRRVRAGDEAAAVELVRRYEPVIRRVARVRLLDARLRRLVDSGDICQSVLASFFVRAALGQYELNTPEQLLKLLATMARNKLVNWARHQRLEHPEGGPAATARRQMEEVATPVPSPSHQLVLHELLQEARRRLSAEERQLLELRQQGREWADIAAELGGTPEALRKRLARAVDLVAQQLGLSESGHD
jgi:RNA polymerase sigma-70 factor (ECF subfamily)